jgi:transposase-like protein
MAEKRKNGYEFGDSEGDRRSTEEAPNSSRPQVYTSTEVKNRTKRRSFSNAYKLKILNEADRCPTPGDVGKLVRREGIYFSYLTEWRRERDKGKFYNKPSTKQKRIEALERDKRKLQRELSRSKLIIEAQKKILELLEMEDLD